MLLPSFKIAHNDLRKYFLGLPNIHSSYWLDFDSTAKTLYGNQEGVVKGYNPRRRGKKSYHPLICTEAHFQDCLGGELRYGNAYTSDGVLDMLDLALSILPRSARSIRARADAGFYDGNFIAKLSEKNIGFAVVAPVTQLFKNKLGGLHYKRINDHESASEFKYQPNKWKDKHRFAVLREKLTKERREQLKLFIIDKYAYHIIVNNLKLSPYGAFGFYEDRAGMERIIRTMKEDYPFATAPTNDFIANQTYAELSLLSYNIIIWFKRLCLPDDWQSYTVETLRHRLLLVPGVFVKSHNKPTLKLPKNNPNKDVFEYAKEQINGLRPFV